MTLVCRYTEIQASDQIDGFILNNGRRHHADGFLTTSGFEEIADELNDAGFVLSLREAK
jgi:hypothetical protein